MDSKNVKTNLVLILAAMLWGFGFVAQRDGMNYIGPFLYTTIRFGIGVLCLLPVYFMTRKQEKKIKIENNAILFAGLIVGVFLFLGVSAQQIGLQTTTAGKASFITSLYMVLVPVFGIVLGHKTTKTIWISILIALGGLYFMSISKNFNIEKGDIFVIACAILWAVHFLFIAHYSSRVGAIRLSILQFFVCAVLSLIVALFTEEFSLHSLTPALPSLLYGGIGAVGIAYTLHVVALKDANPAYASLILSTESVFGALGGWLILHETMTSRQLLGAGLIMTAVLFSQIKIPKNKIRQKIS
ncbi:MAG: DMT family transporter [Candidatus Marinimicrobia bacterium]|nr:DMT family transporter [Candidatus Neomarinimicrobiota bacterium]